MTLNPEQLAKLQILVDAWERRPRRQLDYSLLTPESQGDVEWTTQVLIALIPAVPAIREAFNLQPTPPIVIEMLPPLATPSAPAPAAGSDTPSKPAATAPKKGRSSGSPKKASAPARKPSVVRQKPGSAGKSASVAATPPATPLAAAPAPAASATSPASLGADMSDPPAPTLTTIG
jgi:hypothetical protein